MSADNGVYILKTGNQYRVKHCQAIENLYWYGSYSTNLMNPRMVYEMFGDCKYTYNADKAIEIAKRIYSHLSCCEYGICLLDADMSWDKILKINKIKEIEN